MDTIEAELRKNGIENENALDIQVKNEIAIYVANVLSSNFPEIHLNFNTLFLSINKLKMYEADMPQNQVGACYFYKNNSIYFKRGLKLHTIKELAVHECIHHFQEIKDANGVLHRMGLCTYVGNKAYGNALNEASVQLMASYANRQKGDTVTYYGMSLPTDSPNYYPLLCNLMKQIAHLTGFGILFESTFYSNDAFFDRFKNVFGVDNALDIQSNFQKILNIENKINELNYKIQNEELSYKKFNKLTKNVAKYKEKIRNTFLSTQNLIITSYFDKKLNELQNASQIEEYRKTLYRYSNLIGTTSSYTFFNDYYIKKMAVLDTMYEKMSERVPNNLSMIVQKTSKFASMFNVIKKLFTKNKVMQNDDIDNF